MGNALVIVESPAKAKTINKFLGRGYVVKASMGHVRDLPKRKLGVDEETFDPTYETLPEKKKTMVELKKAAKHADSVYLAADPDREGEAICWHLQQELEKETKATFHRVLFNEITKRAVRAAFEHPLEIDSNKVDAQQARRILDRLVGYKISPLLWDKVRRGLSAGRVQSVAARIICEREAEIRAFETREYWSLTGQFEADQPPQFRAKLVTRAGKKVEPESQEQMIEVLAEIGWRISATRQDEEKGLIVSVEPAVSDPTPFEVVQIEAKQSRKRPAPPFTTSKLQQDAARQLGYSVSRTMRLAQRLYEGTELGEAGTVGLITYMRTDSTRVSDDALGAVREFITNAYGKKSLPDKPRVFRVGKRAQEAHEAIRPTSMEYAPDDVKAYLGRDELRLYSLIWNRFVASQMASAIFDTTRADIQAGRLIFRANGSVLRFPGWLAVYEQGREENDNPEEDEANGGSEKDRRLPQLKEGQVLDLRELLPKQHFTQPPPRFSEATLVKELEENGIGRPSTYASILSTIQNRDYVEKENKRFHPTELGLLVNELMVESFGDIVQVGYTARMEEELDRIEEGRQPWKDSLREFKVKFDKDLDTAKETMRSPKREEIPTDQTCDKCGETMVLKWGKFGQFLACKGYPDCKNTREINGSTDVQIEDRSSMPHAAKVAKVKTEPSPIETEADPCEKCGKPMVLRRGRYGQFLACSGYPDCKTTRKVLVSKDGKTEAKADVLLDDKCPNCDERLALKQGRYGEFTACSSYPKCRYVKMKETGVKCPQCGGGDLVERRSRRGKLFFGCSAYPDCEFVLWRRPVAKACPDCGQPYLVERVTKKHGSQLICESEACQYVESAEANEVVKV